MVKLTCAFVTWTDFTGCLHDKMQAVYDHVRLWIETLLS
jgi:hypothetical protein